MIDNVLPTSIGFSSAGVKSTSIASKFLMNRESRMNRVEHARQMEMLLERGTDAFSAGSVTRDTLREQASQNPGSEASRIPEPFPTADGYVRDVVIIRIREGYWKNIQIIESKKQLDPIPHKIHGNRC